MIVQGIALGGIASSCDNGCIAMNVFDRCMERCSKIYFCFGEITLPGSGFRLWLILLACVSVLAGFAFSFESWFFVWVLALPFAFFLLLNIAPAGISIWVAFRHLRRARYATAACYASLPFIATVLVIASFWAGLKGETEIRLWRYDRAIAAAQKAGTIVNTDDVWIDPGPPTRARFSHGGSVLAALYVIYAEKSDHAWLNEEVEKCRARPIALGRSYYAIAGSC